MHLRSCSALVLVGLLGCGVFGSDPSEGAGDPADPAKPGDPTQLPPDAPPPLEEAPRDDELTEKYGVFVTPNGTEDGDGTRAHPLASINAAIARVKDSKLRVYVCAGLYKESVTLVSGVSMVGALACDGATWRTSAQRARVEAPASPALQARDIVLGTRFEGFDVVAPAGAPEAPSSIGLLAERASKLVIVGSKLAAGKAADGADGAEGTALTLGAGTQGADGLAYEGPLVPGGMAGTVGYHKGQSGGVGSCDGAAGHDGENGGQGGNAATQVCAEAGGVTRWNVYSTVFGTLYDRSNGVALSGAAGVAGADGANAAIGSLSPEGFTASAGSPGTDGQPGKGGSGGNGGAYFTGPCPVGQYIYGAAGPGGGAGGCPGLAGAPGGGGGASIAALVFASAGLTFKASELVAADGGKGGQGAFGSEPTAGGAAGAPKNGSPPGAPGGAGGRAGFGGNGAGGPSFALAHSGGDPVVAPDTTTKAGAAGAGVAERTRTDAVGNAVTIPASPEGPSKPVHAF